MDESSFQAEETKSSKKRRMMTGKFPIPLNVDLDIVINAISTKPRPANYKRKQSVSSQAREDINFSTASGNSTKLGSEILPGLRCSPKK